LPSTGRRARWWAEFCVMIKTAIGNPFFRHNAIPSCSLIEGGTR
jgi:hypothetical protein